MNMVDIVTLKVTSDDLWLTKRIKEVGESIYAHPNYLALEGDVEFLEEWMKSIGRNVDDRLIELIKLMEDIKDRGQMHYIVISKDGQILNGHKRTAVMAFLGYKKIKAKIQ